MGPRFQPSIAKLLAISFILFTGSFVIDQAFRWTDPWQGALNGLFHVPFFGILWLGCGLIPGVIIYGLYRWRGWSRFRTILIIAPGLIAIALEIVGLVTSPMTPANRLKQTSGADLPPSAQDLRTKFSGGGIADYSDTYYFRCTASDTDKLIQSLDLHPPGDTFPNQFRKQRNPSWPDPTEWEGYQLFIGDREQNGFWFFYLYTDATRTQVLLCVGCY